MGDIASKRTVLDTSGDTGVEGSGVIVAAGDVIPEGAPYRENSPNKVDAAANADVADAADQAQNPRPATQVVSGFGNAAEPKTEPKKRS